MGGKAGADPEKATPAEEEGDAEEEFANLLANHNQNVIPDHWICRFWHSSMDPHKSPIKQWEIGVLMIIGYSTMITPYRAAFGTEYDNDWYDWLVDACFYFDILRTFWTSYDRGYDMETSKPLIIRQYLTGWFTVDILSTLNWDIFVYLLSFSSLSYQEYVEVHPYLRLVKMLKATRILKAPRMVDSLSQRRTFNSAYIQTVKFFFIVVIVAHILACLFFLLPEILGCTDWEMTNARLRQTNAGSGIMLSEEQACMAVSWRQYYSTADLMVDDMDSLSQWIQAMYWSLTTMTTIGYGDRGPQTQHEIAFTMIAEVLGLMIFAVLLNQITVFAAAANVVNEFDNDIKNRLVQQLKNNDVPHSIIYQVVEYLCFAKSTHAYTNPDSIHKNPMSYLSASLQRDIRVSMYTPIINRIGIFTERKTLRQMFDEADADGGGKLDRGEVKDLLARVGMNPAKADSMMNTIDEDGEGEVTFDELYQWHFRLNHPEIPKPVPLCLLEELACLVVCTPLMRDELVVPVGEFGNALYIVRSTQRHFTANPTPFYRQPTGDRQCTTRLCSTHPIAAR